MSQIGFFYRFISFLFLVGLIAVGGFMAYQAGISQGIAQAPDLAAAIQGAEAGSSVPAPGYGYLNGLGYPSFFNLFGAVCLSILFVFFFFGLVRFIFCSKRYGRQVGQMPDSNLNQVV